MKDRPDLKRVTYSLAIVMNASGAEGTLGSHPTHKDEYLEDPLPDLVGNLTIIEEPEPDLTLLDQEFVLEDFEFIVSDEEDSGSDLEFFDASTNVGAGRDQHSRNEGLLSLPEHENVHVELDDSYSINNCDHATGSFSRLDAVKDTARKVAASVKGIGRKQKVKKHIRVTYHNLDKPYTARVSSSNQYKNFLTLGEG